MCNEPMDYTHLAQLISVTLHTHRVYKTIPGATKMTFHEISNIYMEDNSI